MARTTVEALLMAHRIGRSLVSLVVSLGVILGVASVATAQQATPIATDLPIALAAGGLAFPRGFAWDANGTLHVSLAGTGGDTGSVVRIDHVCPVTVASGLPSTRGMDGAAQG